MARFLISTVGLAAELTQLGLSTAGEGGPPHAVLLVVGCACSGLGMLCLADIYARRLMGTDEPIEIS